MPPRRALASFNDFASDGAATYSSRLKVYQPSLRTVCRSCQPKIFVARGRDGAVAYPPGLVNPVSCRLQIGSSGLGLRTEQRLCDHNSGGKFTELVSAN